MQPAMGIDGHCKVAPLAISDVGRARITGDGAWRTRGPFSEVLHVPATNNPSFGLEPCRDLFIGSVHDALLPAVGGVQRSASRWPSTELTMWQMILRRMGFPFQLYAWRAAARSVALAAAHLFLNDHAGSLPQGRHSWRRTT